MGPGNHGNAIHDHVRKIRRCTTGLLNGGRVFHYGAVQVPSHVVCWLHWQEADLPSAGLDSPLDHNHNP
jgi:hypothetical protein